jgi:alpha-L-fucosidase
MNNKMNRHLIVLSLLLLVFSPSQGQTQATPDKTHWFREARLGLFIHWGLFAQQAGIYQNKRYYGISEWLQYRAAIPVTEYEKIATQFNPTEFNADEWVQWAKSSGFRYIVITAKHHEGFAMFQSMVSSFNIVDATPYKKDPLKALATACEKAGIRLGFYYSQFQDWHEPNGGGNHWDFDEAKKNYPQYYSSKSLPQIRELLTHYGKIGLIWFDTPGNMNADESRKFMEEVEKLQPECLISSRVGNGLGDYIDFGDGEIPHGIVKKPWEAIFTHNDSWGYSSFDHNFKSPTAVIRLLCTIASKGGNLLINVGPDAKGRIPQPSLNYFSIMGDWLQKNGESIYASTYGPIKQQPWGVITRKENRLYLHVFERPANGRLLIPATNLQVQKAFFLDGKKKLRYTKTAEGIEIFLPEQLPDTRVSVVTLLVKEPITEAFSTPEYISRQHRSFSILPDHAHVSGNARVENVTFSHYFGDWKYATSIGQLRDSTDAATYRLHFNEPGDYKISLEYSADKKSEGKEGVLELNGQPSYFQVLYTGDRDVWKPALFIKHTVSVYSATASETVTLRLRPLQNGLELFKLKRILIEPID